MSRSRRKNLVFPVCCNGDTQKPWKKHINRIFRRKAKVRLDTSIDENGEVLKDYFFRDRNKQKFADIWLSPSDGFHTMEMLSYDEWSQLKREDAAGVARASLSRWGKHYNSKHTTYDEYVSDFKRKIITK
jgi:hypothetical protein